MWRYAKGRLAWAREETRAICEVVSHVQVMYECNRSQSETLAEAVPEAMKNVLLVMATHGILTPAWTVSCASINICFESPPQSRCSQTNPLAS